MRSKGKAIVRRALPVLIVAIALSIGGTFAQDWSAAQKDVWKNVEAYWDLAAKRDLNGFLSYFHDEYSGWSLRSPLPGNKELMKPWITHEFATTKEVLHSLQPVAIKIHGDIAIVHYYYSMLETDAKNEEKATQGRWTDVLKKQGDKWVLIADHGGEAPSKD